MKKSTRSSPWLRLIPVLFLVLIPVIFYIIEIKIYPPDSGEAWAFALFFLIMYLSLPVLILTILIFGFPLIGGVASLALIPLFLLLFRDSLEANENTLTIWVICVCLFFSGVSGLFIGIWNSRGKQMQDNKSQNNLIR
jgi:hypothetical protein